MSNKKISMEKLNINSLNKELSWLKRVLKVRFDLYFGEETKFESINNVKIPDLSKDDSIYARFVKHYKFSGFERLAIILTLTPHLQPQILDSFFIPNEKIKRGYTEFGGIIAKKHSGFIPTGETLSFILGANDLQIKFQVMKLFRSEHFFATHNILSLNPAEDNEPELSGTLEISQEFFELFTFGKASKPNFNAKFPAKLINTKLDWDYFIADENLLRSIDDILLWIKHNNKILKDWKLDKIIKPGYRALFHGPPGTGKTFAASLIGKHTGKDIYKIDLSMIVSKWVGETEKNLARIFDMAENKDWILFFDEADALFGKRTGTQSSQERYANQEVAYLLQRTENFPGTIILASNLRSNMDEAFTRRFQSIIYFPIPKAKQRLKIWTNYFSSSLKLSPEIDLTKIAEEYEITGGGVVNVLKYCAIHAAENDSQIVDAETLKEGIINERIKEGKVI